MKMFWFLLLAGIALFVGSSIYNFKECTAFQTDWYACTIPNAEYRGLLKTSAWES